MSKLEVVTTEYKLPSNIMQAIWETRINFVKKFGKEPKAIVLGPNEYLGVIEVIQQDFRYASCAVCGYPSKLMGMDLRVKQSNGIECEIEPTEVFRHAKGVVN
jgi:hypothetical protein